MKTQIVILIVLAIALFAGCAAQPICKQCPAENSVFVVGQGHLIKSPKGFFAEEKRGTAWMTEEEFKRNVQENRRREGGL